jgi:hypothetical protein
LCAIARSALLVSPFSPMICLKIAPEIAAHLAHPEFCVFASRDRAGAVDWLKGAQA